MGKVTGSWERPIQGVSQQADKDRINGQCTLQENFTPSPLQGLVSRTGTRHISKILDEVSPNSFWYQYSRGNNEDYLILIEPLSYPRVFDLQGNERVVNVGTVSDNYLKVSNPKDVFVANTIADFTFLLNRGTEVSLNSTASPQNPDMTIVYLQFATYGRDYSLILDGNVVAKYRTPNGADAETDPPFIRTNYITQLLADQINGQQYTVENHEAVYNGTTYEITLDFLPSLILSIRNTDDNITVEPISINGQVIEMGPTNAGNNIRVEYLRPGGNSGFTATVSDTGNVMFVTKDAGGDFTVSTVDSADGNDLIAIQDRVQQLSNLPPAAPNGYTVKVQNQEGFEANSYWLKAEYSASEGTGSKVRWVETTEPGSQISMNKSTLPHQLVSESDGTFTLSHGEWEGRSVGNNATNPFPSFVGQSLSSIGTFQGRLLVTSGESVVMTRSNNFFNFFRETTQESTDADPIDAYADTDDVNNLEHHETLDGDIIFFAENGQFLLNGSQVITKENVILTKTTSYPMSVKSRPAVTGESVMFAFKSGKFTGIREMYTDSYIDTKRARPITEHVSEFIEGEATRLITSPNINTMLIQTPVNPKVLFMYDWIWVGDTKAQSAFHKWIFDGDVLYVTFVEDKLYFVIDRGTGIFLEVMPISSDTDDSGLDFSLSCDQRVAVNATWTGVRWEWVLPYEISDPTNIQFVRGAGCWEEDRGTGVDFETDGLGNYWTKYDLADTGSGITVCTLTAGTPYTCRYIPTQPFLKDYNGRVLGIDRFTMGKAFINYESIGDIKVTVRQKSTLRSWEYSFNGRFLGGWNNKVGFAPQAEGTFQFPVRLESDKAEFEISTDSFIPLIIRDMEWQGMLKQRGRRY